MTDVKDAYAEILMQITIAEGELSEAVCELQEAVDRLRRLGDEMREKLRKMESDG